MSPQVKSIIFTSISLCLIWSLTIPLWHFPDEQAHFAQVQDYAEVKTVPTGNDVSFEIFESTRILGTLRDDQGRNKYTPTPGYQLPLSSTKWGYQETYLSGLNESTRKLFVEREAPHYAPLYYVLGSFIYQQASFTDVFTRVFLTRLVSVVLFGLMVVGSWLVARELFPSQKKLQLAVTGAIGFHPMLMFVGAGINNDILMNAAATFLIAKSLVIIRRRITLIDLVHLTLLVGISLMTKQLIYLLFPMVLIALFISWWRHSRNLKFLFFNLTFIILGILAYLMLRQNNGGFWLPYWPSLAVSPQTLWLRFIEVVIKLYRETLPWYWGVYRWLGLVLPLWLLRLIKLTLILSLVGGIKTLFLWRKNLLSPQLIKWYWLITGNVFYVAALVLWESINFANHGFGHGLQGRYFFPLISTHMALLIAGWWAIGGKKLQKYFPALVIFVFCLFNIYSLWYVLGAYYHRFPLSLFVIELSQYKPAFAKWPSLLIPVSVCLISLGYMTKQITSWIRSTKRS